MAKDNLDKRIDAIVKRSNTLGKDVHTLGVDLLKHAEEHSDPRKLDRLYTGLHKSCRPEAFKAWVEKFSPIRWNGDGKVGMLKATSKKFTPFDVEAANNEPYWTPQETVKKPLTLAALKAIVAQMEKKLEKAEDNDLIAEGENVILMREFVKRVSTAAVGMEAEAA